MSLVSIAQDESLAIIIIDNPPVNALNTQVFKELCSRLDELSGDDSVKVVIFTGAGDNAFVAGADLKELAAIAADESAINDWTHLGQLTLTKIDNFPKPTIACINSLAIGGGCELALACDLRVAACDAKLGLPEVSLGLLPGGGGTQRLPRLIGEAKAKELMFTGNVIEANEAGKIGLVNVVVPPDEAMSFAKELGNKIAKKPGVALNYIKQCVDKGLDNTLAGGLELELQYFQKLFRTADALEGIDAFINKRKPAFKNR